MSNYYSKTEYREIASLYKLGAVRSLFRIDIHLKKDHQTLKTVVATPRGRFVISKHELSRKKDTVSKSVRSLQYEIDLLDCLKSLPVPHYVRSHKGNFIEKFGDGWVTVDKFFDGKSPDAITPKMAYRLGYFLGSFHVQGKKFRKVLPERRKFYDLSPPTMRMMGKYAFKQKNPLLKSVVEEVKKGVETTALPDRLPKGPIHVDINPQN